MPTSPGNLPAHGVKSSVEADVNLPTVRAAAALVIDPVAFIKVRTLTGLAASGTIITVDSTLGGGGIDALQEGVAWNVGATLAVTATNIAAAIQAALQVHNGTWTCTATDDWMVLTLTGQFAAGDGCTVASDGPEFFQLNYQIDSALENFTLWQAGDGYEDENDIEMAGNDMLYLFITAHTQAASTTTELLVRLMLMPGDGEVYDETAMDIGAAVAGVMPVDLLVVEYQLPVVAGESYRSVLSVPVDMPGVRVLLGTTGEPDADDNVGIGYTRAVRNAVSAQ